MARSAVLCEYLFFVDCATTLKGAAQIHFFAHLTVARVVSPQSMLSLLQSLTAVLDEFGVSHARAKRAARSAAEGLMRVSVFSEPG